jgi:hypothetical protein
MRGQNANCVTRAPPLAYGKCARCALLEQETECSGAGARTGCAAQAVQGGEELEK